MELVELTGESSPDRTAPGLAALDAVTLSESHAAMLAAAAANGPQDGVYSARWLAETRDVLALQQLAPRSRLAVQWLEFGEELRMLLALGVRVARRPDQQNQLRVADHAVLGLMYPRAAVHQALPGTAFFDILEPLDIWHPNAAPPPWSAIPRLCLGPELMAGIRCVDLILIAYGALSMQAVQIDERDSAGVLNLEAARWWQQNLHRAPLCDVPFLEPDPPRGIPQDL